MNTSSKQISEIAAEENFRATAYADGMINGVQQHSIGYGHQIQPNEKNLLTASVSKDWALNQLKKDLKPVEDLINKRSRYPVTQSQFDGLADFGFNCGVGALSKVLDTWNSTHDMGQVADHIKQYNKTRQNGELVVSQNLVERRLAEVADLMAKNPGTTALLFIAGAFVLFS